MSDPSLAQSTFFKIRSDSKIDKIDYLIIMAPLVALLLTYILSTPRETLKVTIYARNPSVWLSLIAISLSHLHLAITVFRTHFNVNIFKRNFIKLSIIPLCFIICYFTLPKLAYAIAFITFLWDLWHSGLQIYGLGRIFDFKILENANQSHNKYLRFSESLFCLAIVLGPHLFALFSLKLDIEIQQAIQYFICGSPNNLCPKVNFNYLQLLVFTISTISLINYLIYNLHLKKTESYYTHPGKILLYLSVTLTSILSASQFSLIEMICIHNIYHALHYYIVMNKYNNIYKDNPSGSKLSIFFKNNYKIILGISSVALIFIFAKDANPKIDLPLSSTGWMIASLLHFYVDGFIWSVSKNEVSTH